MCLRTDSLGVSVPFSRLRWSGTRVKRFTVLQCSMPALASSTSVCTRSSTAGSAHSSATVAVGDAPSCAAIALSAASSGKSSAVANFCPAPTTTACSMSGEAASAISTGWGMTYLPVDSLKRSFLRSVMRSQPSGVISPMSPVANHPSLESTSAVATGFL